MSAIISIKSVSKKFIKNQIFDNLSLDIEAGKIYLLIGKNGAGKSTLLKMVAGHLHPDQGTIKLFGNQSTFPPSPDVFIVTESVESPGRFKAKVFFKEIAYLYPAMNWESFLDKCKKFQLPIDNLLSDLSRGQRMLMTALFGLVSGVKILLLDEVTAVLDSRNRRKIMQELGSFQENGGTVILATNITIDSQNCGDEIILLESKKIALSTSLSNLDNIFLKLRVTDEESGHSILQNSALVDIGANSDKSMVYLMARSDIGNMAIPESLIDRRAVTAEDVFQFYSRKHEISSVVKEAA